MGKQKAKQDASAGSKTNGESAKKEEVDVAFPAIGGSKQKAPRTLVSPDVLAPDQIVLYRNALTNAECESIIEMFAGERSTLTMQASPPARKGEAERTNFRFSCQSTAFAKQLYEQTGLAKEVAEWPSMFAGAASKQTTTIKPVGLSSNIRVYRYDPGAIFACHYDDHSTDPVFGPSWGKTEWTVLIYLSGHPDVEGGQTVFYKSHVRPKNGIQSENAIVAPLVKGAALLHRHGRVCMLHEALPPTKGTKWVLRSDLVFGAA